MSVRYPWTFCATGDLSMSENCSHILLAYKTGLYMRHPIIVYTKETIMYAKAMSAFDAVMNTIFAAFKKVAVIVVLTAVLASMITASIMLLGFNVIQ